MKKYILKSLYLFLAVAVFFTACKKDDEIKLGDPTVETITIDEITDNSAIGYGVVLTNSKAITEKGICFGKTETPTIDDNIAVADLKIAAIKAKMSNLEYLQKYYFRTYAKYKGGVVYGDTLSFVSGIRLAKLNVAAIMGNTGRTAVSGGVVENNGGGTVSAKGVCWSTSENPTTDDNKTNEGEGIGYYTSILSPLLGNTQYYVRAYVTNESGTYYTRTIAFVAAISTPEVTTVSASGGETTATVKGNVTFNGGASVTERGICYSTSENPTTADNTVTDPGTIGEFEVDITGLTTSTTYHARAYATNSVGTEYGDDIEFSTYPADLYMTGSGVDDGLNGWDWDPVYHLVPVHSHPELFWKIIWMYAGGEFKFAPQADWGGDFGRTGDATSGIYTIGSDNVPAPATSGYYMVVVNLKNNTIQVTAPLIYGIGGVFDTWDGAQPGNLFTVDNANDVIKFVGAPYSDNLRMHVAASTLECDWWQAEVNILAGNIVFRGTGGDPANYPVTAGQTIELNFKAGTGSVFTP